MKKILGLLVGTSFLCSMQANAQNEVDALRYSQITFGGTARSTAMGGAFGALGADFSTLSSNPGGLGVYRKSEFSVTPSIYYQSTASDYNSVLNEDEKYNLNFNNFGFVLSNKIGKDDDIPEWKFVNFGFGYNRYNNFNNRMFIQGRGTSSILDTYLNDANGTSPDNLDQFGSGMAFNTYLIDTVPSTINRYFSDITSGGQTQQKTFESTGGMGETVFSVGGNYADKIFVGGTFAFPRVRYSEEVMYEEADDLNSIGFFKSMQLNQRLNVTGSGFNFKGGIIFKPADFVRIGASLHTPSFFRLTETYSADITGNFDNGSTYTSESPSGKFDYRLKTPMRATGSLAFVLGKYAVISGEYEFVDYASAKLRSTKYNFNAENSEVKRKYTAAGNLRTGAEVKYENFAFRLGYALYGNPFKSGINNSTRNNYTVGLGWRDEDYYLDVATVFSNYKENYYLYDPSVTLVNPTKNTINSKSFLLTFGYRF
ncbi:MAG: hypothetical protein V4667_11560 [Bacteroidota bacterium]